MSVGKGPSQTTSLYERGDTSPNLLIQLFNQANGETQMHSKLIAQLENVSVRAKPSCNYRRDQLEAPDGEMICLATAQGNSSAT